MAFPFVFIVQTLQIFINRNTLTHPNAYNIIISVKITVICSTEIQKYCNIKYFFSATISKTYAAHTVTSMYTNILQEKPTDGQTDKH